jgi:hypothetical protein
LKSKSTSILLSVFVLAIVGLSLISVPVAASGVGVWKSTTSYPKAVERTSCVVSGGYIYCVGGDTSGSGAVISDAYFAKLSSSGVGVWMKTTSYPFAVNAQSCVASGGYIYCVGGFTGGTSFTNAVYFASLSSSGVGSWKKTTNYPRTLVGLSCVVGGGYIYCVGGFAGSATSGTQLRAVYFASLSSSGVGAWKMTTSYPTPILWQSCVVSGGYIYCEGDDTAVYFASLSSGGVGTWTKTKSYPTVIIYQSCVVSGGHVYCIAGFTGSADTNAVYSASLSSSGVGFWKLEATSYPTSLDSQSCVVNDSYIYCVAGFVTSSGTTTKAVYFTFV